MKEYINTLRHKVFEQVRLLFLIPKQPIQNELDYIRCKKEDLENRFGRHHLTAQNPVKVINPPGYFRECRKHERASIYLQKATIDFFEEILPSIPINNGGGILLNINS